MDLKDQLDAAFDATIAAMIIEAERVIRNGGRGAARVCLTLEAVGEKNTQLTWRVEARPREHKPCLN